MLAPLATTKRSITSSRSSAGAHFRTRPAGGRSRRATSGRSHSPSRRSAAAGRSGLVFPPAAIAFAFALAGAVGLRWLAWKRTAMRSTAIGCWFVRAGGAGGCWCCRSRRIQSADLAENFVSRRFGTANLRLGVAGGAIAGEIIPAIPSATARQLREQMLSPSHELPGEHRKVGHRAAVALAAACRSGDRRWTRWSTNCCSRGAWRVTTAAPPGAQDPRLPARPVLLPRHGQGRAAPRRCRRGERDGRNLRRL